MGLEETKASLSIWRNKTIMSFGFASLFSDFSYEAVSVVLPAFIVGLVGPVSAPLITGLIGGVSEFAAGISRLVSGIMTDYYYGQRKAVIVSGYSLTAFFLGIMGFAQHIWFILVCRTIAWIGKGIREAPRDALLVASVPTKLYGRAFGFNRSLDTIGAILGPLSVFFLSSFVSIRSILFLSIIPGLIATSIIFFFIPNFKRNTTQNLTKNFKLKNTFINLPKSFIIFLLSLIIFYIGAGNKLLIILRTQDLLAQRVQDAGIISVLSISALAYVFFSCFRALSEYVMGILSDKINLKILLACFGYGLFGLLSFGFAREQLSVLGTILIFMLFGISSGAIKVLARVQAARLLPEEHRGTGFALVQLAESIGDVVASAIIGFLWTHFSVHYAFGYTGIITLCASFMLLGVSFFKKSFIN